MTVPSLTRYADILRYDSGLLRAIDWRGLPERADFLAYEDAEALAAAIETAAVRQSAAPYAAGSGLALAARAWADRPTEARRGAIIQAGERLRAARRGDRRLARLVEQALARADAAVLAGGDAEQALVSFVSDEISRADRAAERCGRIAAGLLDESDRVLAHGFAGPPLGWLLHVALTEQHKPIALLAAARQPEDDQARLVVALARVLGVGVELVDKSALEQAAPSVFVAGVEQLALDGSIAGARGTRDATALARRLGLPRYILAPDGPDPDAQTGADLIAADDITPPELISAIITSRGIYRPEMIARHLGDGDAPLDVIPLSLG
jgi:methylthioribose-1-phosphate isomerase